MELLILSEFKSFTLSNQKMSKVKAGTNPCTNTTGRSTHCCAGDSDQSSVRDSDVGENIK